VVGGHLVSAELFLSHALTPHFWLLLVLCRVFPLLHCVIPEVLPPSLMGSALASGGSVLELSGTGSVGHRGSFWQLLTEATPVAPLLPKPVQYCSWNHLCTRPCCLRCTV